MMGRDARRKAGGRKRTAIALCALMLALGLTACGQTGQNQQTGQGGQDNQNEQSTHNDQNSATEPAAEGTTGMGQEAVSENVQESTATEAGNAPAGTTAAAPETDEESTETSSDSARDTTSIRLTTEDGTVIEYSLNDSQAAADLYSQLPLTIEVEDYSTNEKIFYPPEELDTGDTPEATGGAGVLAYYEPWGDVVLFYDDFGTASGLYELGTVTSGSENISELSGSVRIEQAEEAE